MTFITELDTWKLLDDEAKKLSSLAKDNLHSSNNLHPFKLTALNLNMSIDFSHQHINQEIFRLLLNLAHQCQLKQKITALLEGEVVNKSQKIPALHTALRAQKNSAFYIQGSYSDSTIMPNIMAVREQMHLISNQVRSGLWLGYSGKAIISIVNIGMGGSDFGPRFCVNALKKLALEGLDYHFISDIDPHSFDNTVKKLNPETTLFIISSKSFTTHETLYNAKKALAWVGTHHDLEKHFIAVTANALKAKEFGITKILPIWEWVGGRYSYCSAINLITCIAIGYNSFMELLNGAHQMDLHFHEKEFHENMPVMLALLGIWNINFLHIPNLLLLVYANQLELFVPYIQQLDMESNGKSIDNEGRLIDYETGPIVWGGIGNQAQHSYYQLLCQSKHKIAADFISVNEYKNYTINSMCEAKIRVLSQGVNSLSDNHGFIAGGMPINHISIDACNPFNLGALIALYEHKVYVQSVLWNINAFDQPGVESAKKFVNEF